VVVGCFFKNFQDGVRAWGTDNVIVTDNVFDSCGGTAGAAVQLEVTCYNCVVYANVMYTSNWGIYCSAQRSVIYGNVIDTVVGIGIQPNSDCVVVGNAIRNATSGYGVTSGTGSVVRVCVAFNSLETFSDKGIDNRTTNATDWCIAGNAVVSATNYGIEASGSGTEVVGNVVSTCGVGIYVDQGDRVVVCGNIVTGSSTNGIYLLNTIDRTIVACNRVDDTAATTAAINLDAGSGVAAVSNTINTNANGFLGSGSNHVVACNVVDAGVDGIDYSGSAILVAANRILDFGVYGIVLTSSDLSVISSNVVQTTAGTSQLISLAGTSRWCVVDSNVLIGGSATQCNVTSGCYGNTVSGNILYDSASNGITINNSGNVAVKNLLYSTSSAAITSSGNSRILIAGCVIVSSGARSINVGDTSIVAGCVSYGSSTQGVYCNGGKCSVVGNMIYGGSVGIYTLTGSNSSSIVGNVLVSVSGSGINVNQPRSVIAFNSVISAAGTQISLGSNSPNCSVVGNVVVSPAGNDCIVATSSSGSSICGNLMYGGNRAVYVAAGGTTYLSICSNFMVAHTNLAVNLADVGYSVVCSNVFYNHSGISIKNNSGTNYDNVIVGNVSYSSGSDTYSVAGTGIIVAGNVSYNSGGSGINVESSSHVLVNYNAVIDPTPGISMGAINLEDVSYSNVCGNEIQTDTARDCIRVYTSSASITTIVISGNMCNGVGAGNGITLVGDATYNISDYVIKGNVIYGNNASVGVSLSFSKEGLVNKNRIRYHATGISEGSNCDNNLFGLNQIKGNTTTYSFSGTNRSEFGNK
jgi:parallel beta-helix repeat protein